MLYKRNKKRRKQTIKKNLIASLLSVVVLSGCNGKSLNGLTFSDRKKRATIVDKDLDRKQEVKTVSREATFLDSSRYSIYGNLAWQVSDDNSTATIYVINQNISKLTDDAFVSAPLILTGTFLRSVPISLPSEMSLTALISISVLSIPLIA